MEKATTRCLLSVFITLLMVLTVTQPIVGSAGVKDSGLEPVESETLDMGDNVITQPSEGGLSTGDIKPFDNEQGPDKQFSRKGKLIKVIIVTTDVAELATLLLDYEYNGLIGTKSSNSRGIAFPILEVPSNALVKISQLPNVLGVYDYKDEILDSKSEQNLEVLRNIGETGPLSQTDNVNAASLYNGAESAWANGFTGKGVNVATISAGCDFGNYELAGRQAVIGDDYIFSVTNEVVVAYSDTLEDNRTTVLPMPEYHVVFTDTVIVYENDPLTTKGYTVSPNGTLVFDEDISPNTWINASYTYRSPYYQYPIAFDPTSMISYLTDGLPPETVTPTDSWYVNTSSTDLRILHTPLVDGVNDFWNEINIHRSSDDTFNLSLTSELKGTDLNDDIEAKELDLTNINVASDKDNWYFGFEVEPETDNWKRSFDVNYGLYIDTERNSGADSDPLDNFIDQTKVNFVEKEVVYKAETHNDTANPFFLDYNGIIDCTLYRWNKSHKITTKLTEGVNYTLDYINGEINTIDYLGQLAKGDFINATYNYSHRPEFALYVHHTGIEWGVSGSSVNWGVNSNGKWSNNRTVTNTSDVKVWSNNNTVQNATFHAWDEATSTWSEITLTFDQPYNETVGIGPGNGTVVVEEDGIKYVKHNGEIFKIESNSSVPYYIDYNQFGYDSVELEMIKGEQASGDDFIEFSIPKEMLPGVDDMSIILFSTGNNRSHAQDTTPKDDNVFFNDADWADPLDIINYTTTTLTNFTFINAPVEYVVDGIPSQSGVYHIGLHPDQNLIENHYGRPVAVLLTDYYEAGVYDTVYVDLDNDKNFTDERPLQAYSAHNETLNIGPRFDTKRYDNGTIYHDGQYYTLYNEKLDENLTIDADGRETEFRLEQRNIIIAPTLYIKPNSGPINNLTRDEYTLDAVNGIITLNEGLIYKDNLVSRNYTHRVAESIENTALINYSGQEREIELRDWIARKDIDSDGGAGDERDFPDLSGGMVYFIADGKVPLPYSDIVADRNGAIEQNRIPVNGELIAFFGEFGLSSAQGTEIGSTISGLGYGIDANKVRLVKGNAPDAKLIAARGGNPFEAWYFAVEGYDGLSGTGDDAQIVAATSSYPVQESGWDPYSKAADYIGSYYAEGKTCFVAGVGGSGYGYGTATSPSASRAVITAGIGTQFDYRNYDTGAPTDLSRVYADSGPNPSHGDVLPSSSRGPNMLGQPEPDVITAGAFLFGSTPLNVDQYLASPSVFEWYGGQWAWDLWTGAALASASTAGLLALVFDAYYQVNDEYPDVDTARSLLRSGADNLNYDILSQGAGYTNADRATKIAANMDGLYLNQTFWVPGDYRGIRYEGFVKLMDPGETESQTFTIENKAGQDSTVEVYDAVFHKFGSYQIPINITRNYDVKDIPGVVNIEPYIAIGTELLKVTATSARKPTMLNYMGEFFDWTDVNENGELDFPDEQNRIAYCIGQNHLELRYRDPLGRVHDGLAVQLKSFGGTGEPLTEWTINLDFYSKTDWDWLDFEGATNIIVPAGGTESFTAKITIPNDADVGSYEGSIYIKEFEQAEPIATGVGNYMTDKPFVDIGPNQFWVYNAVKNITTAVIDDDALRSGFTSLVEKSSIVDGNGTALYESVDYTTANQAVTFFGLIPVADRANFAISYLTVAADNGVANYSATWSGQTNVSNFVKGEGSIVIEKDGNPWNEVGVITDGNVIVATGGERAASLPHRNIVRETLELSKNSGAWPQFGGELSESEIANAGQNTTNLSHGNIVPGSTEIYQNDNLLPQTGEVTLIAKEEVQGLNSTSQRITNELFTIGGGQNTSKSIWYDSNKDNWYGMLEYNGVITGNTTDFTVISYRLYKDGKALTDGTDFKMHIDDYSPSPTHGKFILYHDPSGHTYNASYVYYNHTLTVGQLEHGEIVSESYNVYLNGQLLQSNRRVLNEKTGVLTMSKALGPDQIIEIAYTYNLYVVETRTGHITYSDPFIGGENITVNYSYFTYIIDLPTGILSFADPLNPGDEIRANYSYANYTFDMGKGIVKFANPLLPLEVVTCAYWHYNAMIPVFINIGAHRPDFAFGGDTVRPTGYQDELYKSNEITGGYGSGSGDWRYFYMDVQEQGLYENPTDNQRLFIDVEWQNNLTDVDVQVFGGRKVISAVQGKTLPSDVYGPHTIEHVGGSDETTEFFTTTGGPEEIMAPKISGGLNVIALHTVGMNASEDYTETFSARVGTMYLDPTEVKVVSNELYGEQTISMYSNMEWKGVGGIAAGPSAPESLKNLTVEQDDPDWSNFDTFEAQLASGTTVYSRTIEDCLIFHVHIWGHTDFGFMDVSDLDLGVFLDGSGEGEEPDGIVQAHEFVAMGADWDADEEVKLIAPVDGTYLIVVFGFTLMTDPAHFDMDITIVQGTGFDVTGTGVNNLSPDQKGYFSSSQIEDPFNITHLTLTWDLPGSTTGSMQGALYIGPGNGPMAMLIPIELTIDKDAPEIGESTFPSDGEVTNDDRPLIYGSVKDAEREEIDSVRLFVDGNEVTSLAKVSLDFVTNTAGSGYPDGSAQYIPNVPLSEGAHTAELRASDWATNEVSKKWTFTVDTKKPMVSLDSLSDITYTNQASIALQGTTEQDASVDVMIGALSVDVKRDAVGGFTATIDLFDGDNTLIVTATDAGGNEERRIVTIIRDTEAPVFDRLICLDGTMTNQANTALSGSMNEKGTMIINGDPVSVNSDGTFDKYVELIEGVNVFALEFTDRAGNIAYEWLNVTLDTQAPVINVDHFETTVNTDTLNLTGTTEAGAYMRINGKLVQVTGGTRQETGSFNKLIRLSPGSNTLVVESKDVSGNVNQVYLTVYYDTSGTNYGAIGLMILLLIVGLLIGIMIAKMFFVGAEEVEEEEAPYEEVPPLPEEEVSEEPKEDEVVEEVSPEEDAVEEPLDEDIEPTEVDEMDREDVPAETDEVPEYVPYGEVAEGDPIPVEEGMPEDLPAEEGMPEELPEVEPEPVIDEDVSEPELSSDEIADDIIAEGAVEEALEKDEVPEVETPVDIEEDEKVLKLKKAFEEGKISKELYEKNLKRMQG